MANGYAVLPVVSSGQWGGQAPETYRRTKTIDLLYMAGGGILAHPGGAAAGVRALHQAWEAAVEGLTVKEAADKYSEFAQSVEKFAAKWIEIMNKFSDKKVLVWMFVPQAMLLS